MLTGFGAGERYRHEGCLEVDMVAATTFSGPDEDGLLRGAFLYVLRRNGWVLNTPKAYPDRVTVRAEDLPRWRRVTGEPWGQG